MTTAEWTRVKDLFEAALRLPEAERPAFLAAQPEPPAIVEEARSLLATYQASPDFLEGASPRLPEPSPDDPPPELAGRRIGPWELTREIGSGGMGIVWEARRADEHYEQRVAVKLLPSNLLSEQAVARFRTERQILAGFNHPSIARLLDGGATEDGSPYLVMEFIDGPALDTWCDRLQLDLRARVRLYLSVCAAVEYAHRHLVVHGDLKPANILVGPDGVPKLLDFGIARLIDAETVPRQATSRLLTPEFASPEQLRGGIVTTASDIFSLGTMLYLLLTGRKPFSAHDNDTLGVMRAICDDEAEPPSAAAAPGRELRGELDSIVLQALRKEPEERYPSVRAFADDLRAWLDGRDVSAVRQPWWKRYARVIRHHKTQSSAVALAVVSLVGGAAVSLWEASVAHRQRLSAERSFRDVRNFSRSVLFELHDAIRDLPGATAARNLLLERATGFLDDLARDPSADTVLKVELAEGYNSLGHVQGGAFSENLGHRDAAIASYRKAVRLGESAMAATPDHPEAGLVLLDSYDDLTRALLEKRDLREAAIWHGRQRDLTAQLIARFPREARVRSAVADSYSAQALYRTQVSDYPGARDLYRLALGIYGELALAGFESKTFRTQYAFASKRLGALLISDNALDEAERWYRTALAMEDARVAAAPGDIRARLDRTFTLSDLALILKRKHDLTGAAAAYEQVLATRRAALAADPNDVRNLHLTASTDLKLAALYPDLKHYREAIGFAREAVRLRDRSAAIVNDYAERRDAAQARVILAYAILKGAEDPGFHAAAGERMGDARAALQQAAPMVPNPAPGQVLSPAEKDLKADYDAARTRLARLTR